MTCSRSLHGQVDALLKQHDCQDCLIDVDREPAIGWVRKQVEGGGLVAMRLKDKKWRLD